MYPGRLVFLLLAGLLAFPAVHAEVEATSVSTFARRIDLRLTPEEQAQFLGEMRNMRGSIQDILLGLGASDRSKIIEAARRSGNRLARATPASVRTKMPQAFRDIGGHTHMMFEELAVRAETDDMEMLADETGQLVTQCLARHAAFRAH